jgi:hypothetical protein
MNKTIKFYFFRFSNDIPVQSETVPLLSVYFLACMIYSLCGMIWFAAYNNLKDTASLPDKLEYLLIYYIAKIVSIKKTRNQLIFYYNMKYSNKIEDTTEADISNKKDYYSNIFNIMNRIVWIFFTICLVLFNVFIFVVYPIL